MIEFIKLANFLDEEKQHTESDFILRLALDLSFLQGQPSQGGMFGKFYSNFPKEIKDKLKGQLGNIPHDMGVKEFNTKHGLDKKNFISENLALIYFPKAINQYTDMNAPVINHSLPLSAIINSKFTLTQKMPGIALTNEEWSELVYQVMETTTAAVLEKLSAIGIRWSDCHAENYLVNKKQYDTLWGINEEDFENKYGYGNQEIEESNLELDESDYLREYQRLENSEQNQRLSAYTPKLKTYLSPNIKPEQLDLSTGCSIVDFGYMDCTADSVVAQELLNFRNKLIQFFSQRERNSDVNSQWISIIIAAIDDMVGY